MNDQSQTMNQSQMLNRDYGPWPPVPLPPPLEDPMKFVNQPRPAFAATKPGRGNWKWKVGFKKRMENRWMEKGAGIAGGGSGGGGVGGGGNGVGVGVAGAGGGGYKPPALNELQHQNRLKARRFYPKKKFSRFAPFAPRNTTSFIIRAKKSGGIASISSSSPVTPAVLSTPSFSPSREVLGDMAKEQWGVDGYGSMNGFIRLRPPGHEIREDDEEDEGGSSESDVEEHVGVERRLIHDLSRFEMIYPNPADEQHPNLPGNQVDDQDTHIARLEEENLTLKERLFLMERELMDLRTKLQCLETDSQAKKENSKNKEEILENELVGGIEGEALDEALENEGATGIKEETHERAIENEVSVIREGINVNATTSSETHEAEGESHAIVEASENVSEGGGNVCSEKSLGDLK